MASPKPVKSKRSPKSVVGIDTNGLAQQDKRRIQEIGFWPWLHEAAARQAEERKQRKQKLLDTTTKLK